MDKEKKRNPFVSVIIPTYNRGRVLGEAIDSVLSQEYRNFELIVVDDGSVDDTRSVLEEYRDKVTVITQKNRGVSAARNTGISCTLGSLITFLDSDDAWLPGKLAAQVDFFDRNTDAMICQTEEIWIRNGKRVNQKIKHRKYSGDIFKRSLSLCLVSPSAVMMRRSLFDSVGFFDENLPACEDYDLWLRVSCRYPVYLIDTPLIIKKGGHMDQLSRQPGLDKYRIRSLAKILAGGLLSREQYREAAEQIREKCRIYAEGCRKRGKVEEAEYYTDIGSRF